MMRKKQKSAGHPEDPVRTEVCRASGGSGKDRQTEGKMLEQESRQ